MTWLVLAVLLWGLIHSLLASNKAKEVALKILGLRLAIFYRLAYNIFSGLSFLPVLAVAALTPDKRLYLVPLPWSLLMLFGELLAVVVLLIAFRQTDIWDFIGLRQLSGKEIPAKLTTSGPYRYVRHPLYSTGLAFIWLMPLMTINMLAIDLALSAYIVVGAFFEERKLRDVFGHAYVDYMVVTPMFIPFLKGNKSRRTSS